MSLPANTLLSLITLFRIQHNQQLAALAERADSISRNSTLGGPWTDTPGTAALRELHPRLTAAATR